VHKIVAAALLAAFALLTRPAGAANDAAFGYETIRPALVKVWSFDRSGKPLQSGTGVVVESNAHRSLILTASHVIAGGASVRIDVSRDLHDVAAHVERTGPRDLTLLSVDRGGWHAARFAARTHPVVEGNLVAVAGYVKNDELIGIVGQEPRILFPGTVASRPDNGLYLELENVHIEEGLSGGAVFEPGTGDVLGIVTSRTSDRRGGFADSGALVVVPFLEANNVAVMLPAPVIHAPPKPRAVAVVAPAIVAVIATPVPRPTSPPALPPPLQPLFLAPLPRPVPAATLAAAVTVTVPPPARDPAGGIVSWQAGQGTPSRFIYTRAGCRIAVTIDVRNLQFIVAHQALVAPHRRGALLGISLGQRAASTSACADVADAEPADAAYEPTAMSFNGHHVTMRFAYAGDPDLGDRFPSDVSLDADVDGNAASATLQFFDSDWTGSIALPLLRTELASVSSSW
jgi:trypsin-like peptidase